MNTNNISPNDETGLYEICLKGHLADRWVNHFGGVNIILEESGITRLITMVVDQAALFGLLKQVRNVGLPLLSVNRINPGGIVATDEQPNTQIQSNQGEPK